MASIPTESRIFANRYSRELRRKERMHANQLHSGAATWDDAVSGLYERMVAAKSPIKCAAILAKAIAYLESVGPADSMHVKLAAGSARRAAAMAILTLTAGQNPVCGRDEEGIIAYRTILKCDRRGLVEVSHRAEVAYVSAHALGRLHEREDDLTDQGALGVLAFVAVLGHLTRNSEKHVEGELCLHFGDTLVVGSLKHGIKRINDDNGPLTNGTFYDVRTVLWADEVKNERMLAQGRIATSVVMHWLKSPPSNELEAALAEAIPYLPRRSDDYTLRAGSRAFAESRVA